MKGVGSGAGFISQRYGSHGSGFAPKRQGFLLEKLRLNPDSINLNPEHALGQARKLVPGTNLLGVWSAGVPVESPSAHPEPETCSPDTLNNIEKIFFLVHEFF
jgi:hypothetical protein